MNEPCTSPYSFLPRATCTILGQAVSLAMSSTLSSDREGQPEGRCCQTAFSHDSHLSLGIHSRQAYEVRVCNLFFFKFYFLYSAWSWAVCLTKSLNFMFPCFNTDSNEFSYGLFSYYLLAQQNIYIFHSWNSEITT